MENQRDYYQRNVFTNLASASGYAGLTFGTMSAASYLINLLTGWEAADMLGAVAVVVAGACLVLAGVLGVVSHVYGTARNWKT